MSRMGISPDTTWPAAGSRWKASADKEPHTSKSLSSVIKDRRSNRAKGVSVRRGGDSRRGSEQFSSEAIMKRYHQRDQT
jgi:hypothetical protein